MNKQIAIFSTAFLVVSLVVAANILPRVLAQIAPGELEQKMQAKPSFTNATANQKTVTSIILCNAPNMSQGVKFEALNCKPPDEAKLWPFMLTCASETIKSKGLEASCDVKPIR
jgi:hypothetical protein